MRNCGEDYVAENSASARRKQKVSGQHRSGRTCWVTGTVNEETWAALRAQSCECEEG